MLISSLKPEKQEPLIALFDCSSKLARAVSEPETRKSLILEYIVEIRAANFRRFSKDHAAKIRRYRLTRGRMLFREGSQTISIKREDLFRATSARRVDLLYALAKTFKRSLSKRERMKLLRRQYRLICLSMCNCVQMTMCSVIIARCINTRMLR